MLAVVNKKGVLLGMGSSNSFSIDYSDDAETAIVFGRVGIVLLLIMGSSIILYKKSPSQV